MSINIFVYNLGCPKNEVDGQYYAGLLQEENNIEIIDDYNEAELIIINTCGFIEPAKEESIEAIWEAVEMKNNGRCQYVVVTGCLSQRYHKQLKQEIPEIDGIFGVGEYEKLKSLIDRVTKGQKSNEVSSPQQNLNKRLPRKTNKKSYAYLKIADGCNKNCSYCAIPFIKGGYHSKKIPLVVEEAEDLLAQNFRELILIAQDTTQYGIDIYDETKLTELMQNLVDIPGNYWLRIMYTYLNQLNDDLLKLIAEHDKICNYLDLPIQHVSKNIRSKMNRPGDEERLRNKIAKIKSLVPDISLRTSLMVGFPGETKEDFLKLKKFVKEMEFDRLGAFIYSREEGTEAAKMSGQISEEIKQKRYNELMEIQQEISLARNQKLIGKEKKVIVDEVKTEKFTGRTEYDAPEIDNIITGDVPDNKTINKGDFLTCRINAAFEYELVGEITNEFSK